MLQHGDFDAEVPRTDKNSAPGLHTMRLHATTLLRPTLGGCFCKHVKVYPAGTEVSDHSEGSY